MIELAQDQSPERLQFNVPQLGVTLFADPFSGQGNLMAILQGHIPNSICSLHLRLSAVDMRELADALNCAAVHLETHQPGGQS